MSKPILDVPRLHTICQPYAQNPNGRSNIALAKLAQQDCSNEGVLTRKGTPPSVKTIAVLMGHMRNGNYSYQDALARKPW